MKKNVYALPQWTNTIFIQDCINSVIFTNDHFSHYYLNHVRVYIINENISPFSGGLFHPFVVLPNIIVNSWDKEKQKIVLCHELIHIKSGHIFSLARSFLCEISSRLFITEHFFFKLGKDGYLKPVSPEYHGNTV